MSLKIFGYGAELNRLLFLSVDRRIRSFGEVRYVMKYGERQRTIFNQDRNDPIFLHHGRVAVGTSPYSSIHFGRRHFDQITSQLHEIRALLGFYDV